MQSNNPQRDSGSAETPLAEEDFDLTFELEPEYLFAKSVGHPGEIATKVRCWSRIIEKCRTNEYERLLVYHESSANPSLADRFEAVCQIVALGLKNLKVAYVDADQENSQSDEFCGLVAQNRGVNVSIFATIGQAKTWLLN